jgi:hypothetical protein
MSIELEFQKLMDEAVQKVQEKQSKGELSVVDADDLIHMIAERRQKPPPAWSESTQSCMDMYEYDRDRDDEDRGWQRSSWCGDNG